MVSGTKICLAFGIRDQKLIERTGSFSAGWAFALISSRAALSLLPHLGLWRVCPQYAGIMSCRFGFFQLSMLDLHICGQN